MIRSYDPDELRKLDALKKARRTIKSLQAQVTDKLLKISAQVEGLLEHLSEKEAAHFLHAGCDMELADGSVFVKVTKRIKGMEELLCQKRVQYPLLKALVVADDETREEAVARMRAGATIGSKDVQAIRSHLRRQRLSFSELNAQAAIRTARRLAGRRAANAVRDVDELVGEVMCLANRVQSRMSPTEMSRVSSELQVKAGAALSRFEETYGGEILPLKEILRLSDAGERGIHLAHAALRAIAEGKFGGAYGFALDNTTGYLKTRTDLVDCLQQVTATVPPLYNRRVAKPKPLTYVPKPTLGVLELCAGAGGMALGLERAGFHPVCLIENEKDACATLLHNRPLWPVVQADVRSVDFRQYRSQRIDLLVGGLPCQPYSIEGKGLGKDDPRDLLLEGARAVSEAQPRSFVFENVGGLLHARHADHLGHFLKRLRASGYAIQFVRMEAEDYGVPQERTRILVVGMRRNEIGAFRAPPGIPQLRTNLGDAIGDLMGEHGWKGAKAWTEARQKQIVVRNGVELQGALASTVVGRKGGSREKERLRWGEKGIDIRNVADASPTQEDADRRGAGFLPSLTLRMRARLQAFPDYWNFAGGKDSASRQIGNAVPPPVGKAIGLAVRAALTGAVFDYATLLGARTAEEEQEKALLSMLDAPSLAPELIDILQPAPA